MLDIQRIRQETDAVKSGLELTGTDPSVIDEILALDAQRRKLQQDGDELRAQMNAQSKNIGQEKDPEKRQGLIQAVGSLKGKIKEMAAEAPKVEQALEKLMLGIPNIPLAEVPVGEGESGNTEKAVFGDLPTFDFEPKPHWELMENLGIIDFERGQKISGSRFYVLRGQGARLQRALITWMLEVNTNRFGYTEVLPPYLVTSAALLGTGQLPKFADDLFHITGTDKVIRAIAAFKLAENFFIRSS